MTKNNPNPAGTTPREWRSLSDIRKEEGSGKYPNYWTHRTRSGHVIHLDDSEGNESITIEHRGGSQLQFRHDGSVQMTSHNGQYNIVFGENRMKITGAQDLTVEGAHSLKVKGPSNTTVEGGMNWAVKGDFNVLSENFNVAATKNVNMGAGGNVQMRAGSGGQSSEEGGEQGNPGNVEFSSVGGSVAFTTDKDILLQSKNGNTLIGGKKVAISATDEMRLTGAQLVHIKSTGDEVRIHGSKTVQVKAEQESIQIQSPKNVNVKVGNVLMTDALVESSPPEAEQAQAASGVSAVGSEGNKVG